MNTLKYIIVGVVLYTITACTATHYTVIESKGYTIPVTERLDASPDASVAEIINIYKTKVDSITSRIIGQSEIAMDVERPQSCLSNFTSDLLVETAEKNTGKKCDFGVMNIGGIRTSLPEGDITVGNIFSIFPFENSISVITLKGKDVKDLFDIIARRGGEGVSKQVEVKVWKNGKAETIVIYAKMARGQMTRYIVKNRITNPDALKDFTWEGFRYREDISSENNWIFLQD